MAQVAFPYRKLSVMKGHTGPVFVVRFNRDGGYCLSGGKDRCINLWNPHKENSPRIKEYKGEHGYEVLDLQVTEDNSKFASCGGDKVALFWDVPTGKILRRFRGHEGKINAVAFNKDCSTLVTASYDTTISCWDLRAMSRSPMQTMKDFKDSVSSVVCTDDSIIACSVDGSLRHYDVRMGQCVTDHICKPMTSLRLSADHNCILVSCLDDAFRLFDKKTGELLNTYKGHQSHDYKVDGCLTNSDAHVIGGSESSEILIWNIVEGDVVHRLKGHTKGVCSVDYHPKQSILVSASFDGTVRSWK